MSARAKRIAVSHLASSRFSRRGLRGYFEYRDLGVKRATRGKVIAHAIRARPGKAPHGEWHRHDCKFQFVYVLRGWAVFEYEGVGRLTMRPGTCFVQPPNIRHREIRHSRDLQMLEVVAPAGFKTYGAGPPRRHSPRGQALRRDATPRAARAARKSPGRR